MFRIVWVLIRALVSAFCSRHQLVLENLALRQQLAAFMAKRTRPRIRATDRAFWVLARRLWARWGDVLVIVKPDTVVRWHRAGFRSYWNRISRRGSRRGRPPVDAEVRDLIRQMASENNWGAPRIHGELAMLGFDVSERTVSRTLRGLHRRPEARQSWLNFLRNHREVIAAMDLFVVFTVSFRLLYVLFVVRHGRRRIAHIAVTEHPTAAWVVQQLREAFPYDSAPRHLIFDRDSIFATEVVAAIRAMGIRPTRTAYRSPWQNGTAERWVGCCRQELLDHVVVVGERHLLRLLREYVAYHHEDRTHLGLGKQTPTHRTVQGKPSASARVLELPRVGGLHHRYSWREAAWIASVDPLPLVQIRSRHACVSGSGQGPRPRGSPGTRPAEPDTELGAGCCSAHRRTELWRGTGMDQPEPRARDGSRRRGRRAADRGSARLGLVGWLGRRGRCSPWGRLGGRAAGSRQHHDARGARGRTARPVDARVPGSSSPRASALPRPGARDVTNEIILSVSASSIVSERHPAEHAFDGQDRTAWNEGAPGPGIGEWIEARFRRPVAVSHLTITPGWDYVQRTGTDLFTANRFMTAFDLQYDGGARSFTIPAGARVFRAELGSATTSRIRIVVRAVQSEAARWEDLCISEIRVFEGGDRDGAAVGSTALDTTEVTVDEYARCVSAGACTPAGSALGCNAAERGRAEHPINCVDWSQASAYCGWRAERLPTSAEWTYAAWGGGRIYPWGDDEPDCSRADFAPTGDAQQSCGGRGTSPVGSHPSGATPQGVQDLAGNVWEWTADPGPSGTTRAVRGGTWGSPTDELRAGFSRNVEASEQRPGIGFRCTR